MRKQIHPPKSSGFTFIDGLIVAVTVALVAILALAYYSSRARPRAKAINCTSNLKQIGLAMRMFSNDHGDKFPWQVSTNDGGTFELLSDVLAHYSAVSNEMSSPKVLRCSRDSQKTASPSFSNLSRSNLSYFVGLDATNPDPQTLLSGDRNIKGSVFTNGVYTLSTHSKVAG